MAKIHNKIIIIHPGTQYAYRLANALSEMRPVKKVSLLTWFTLPEKHPLAKLSVFRKRVKPINQKIRTINFPFFEILLLINLQYNKFFKIKNNNSYYLWQTLFGYFLLPFLYFNRKHSIIIVFETCGWPITKYAKKWKIPVVMDFPSISHENAMLLGIAESKYGIKIKELERQHIDFGFNCSKFALDTYKNHTSAIKHFPIWLGTDFEIDRKDINLKSDKEELKICCLANTEQRKGIDLLIGAFNKVEIANKKLYLIGRINPDWVNDYCKTNNLSTENIILTGSKAQQDLKQFLIDEQIDLHILPSRFDSFGMVVPETMALGIPNIVSPYVGAGEMLEHGKDGFVMQKLDINELVNYINNYYAMTSEGKNKFSQSALQKSKQMTWDNYTERVNQVFDEILHHLN